jgi:hypothetical protein
MVRANRLWDKANQGVDIALLKCAGDHRYLASHYVTRHARITQRQPVDDRGKEASGDRDQRREAHFTCRGIGEELDVLDASLELVENRNAPFDEGAAIGRRQDAPRTAIEEPNAERIFEIGDRP